MKCDVRNLNVLEDSRPATELTQEQLQARIQARQARLEDRSLWEVPPSTPVHEIGIVMVQDYGRKLQKQFHAALMNYSGDYGKGTAGFIRSMESRQEWIDFN